MATIETTISCPYTFRINKEYPIYAGNKTLKLLPQKLSQYNPSNVFLIIDSNVYELYMKQLYKILKGKYDTHIIIVPAGEHNKNALTLSSIYDQLLSKGITKNSFCVIVGGGVTGNMAGFACSIVMRGIPFAYIPTTIMAQADATLGGKQAINTVQGKNLLGVFNDPKFIIIDFDFLKTLPQREIACGLAECIKHTLCQDNLNLLLNIKLNNPSLTDLSKIILDTLHMKIKTLLVDPLEINEGKILVYGHTIGHAIETLANGTLNHGECVSIGMVCAAKSSIKLGYATESLLHYHLRLLETANLPTKIPKNITIDKIINQLKYDKKVSDKTELVLLSDIGKPVMIEGRMSVPIEISQLKKILKGCY